MNTLPDNNAVEPIGVTVSAESLTIELSDGRTVSAPTQWFPRLAHGTSGEWKNFRLSYNGIHWPDLNEDISVESLLRGEKSGESAASVGKWLKSRARGRKEPIPEIPLDPKLAKELQKSGILKSKTTTSRAPKSFRSATAKSAS